MRKRIFSFVLALLVMLSIMPVSAMAAESTGWDGTSKTEPATDGDGVYLIGTAEELYWFATKTRTSATKTISGRLISDIDLNNQNWQNKEMGGSSIGSSATGYGGTFDGDGHTISGFYENKTVTSLSSGVGLFGLVTNGTIKNLTVEGKIEHTFKTSSNYDNRVGGVAGVVRGGTIENVVSNVEIVIENDTSKRAHWVTGGIAANVTGSTIRKCKNLGNITGGAGTGGICGETDASTTVENCLNSGSITSLYDMAGGIVSKGSGTVIENCANTGNITGATSVGGIAYGNQGTKQKAAVTRNCYNTGNILSQRTSTINNYVGGILGRSDGTPTDSSTNIVENCYNVGTVSADGTKGNLYLGAISGYHSNVAANNLYYPKGSATTARGVGNATISDTTTIVKSEDELKSSEMLATLGEAFKADDENINQGYPILAWQSAGSSAGAYTISASADSSVGIGKDVEVTLSLTHKTETAYNAYFLMVQYDAEKLAYKGINTDAAVTDENGTLTITGSGTDRACETDNLVLTFTGKAMGSANVAVTSAKIDKSADATADTAQSANLKSCKVTMQVEPAQEEGVYLIGNAEQLKWFAKKSRVSGNEGISARLTADIDLNNENWAGNEFGGTSGYGTGYHGTFDGDGHTISGYYYEVSLKTNSLYHMGMFGYVVKGTVKNLTLDGQMVLDASQATEKLSIYVMGGVVSEVDGGTIENVINDVDITVKNDTNGYARGKVGGVVADASFCSEKDPNGGDPTITNTVVNNCENRGSISGSGYAGGVCQKLGHGATIRNCINTGTVTSYGSAGGILESGEGGTVENSVNTGNISGENMAAGIAADFAYGRSTNAENKGSWQGVLRNCYNTGDVTARCEEDNNTVLAGGIVGRCSGSSSDNIYSSIENCYNTGNVTSGKTGERIWVGAAAGELIQVQPVTNLYYLDGTSEKGIGDVISVDKNVAEAKTEKQLKAPALRTALGEAFKRDLGKINNGYPVLTWQISEGPDEPEIPETDAYTISASKNSEITLGEDAEVTLTVTHSEETVYNSYFINVTYDAEKLIYKGINTDATVKDENGTLIIAGYGDPRNCGTDHVVLTFTGKASGEAEVNVTSAKIDKSLSATIHDAPDALIETSQVTISVGGYRVSLDENFDGNDTVMPGADYTFAAKDLHYNYTIDAKMGDGTADVKDNGDGTFTISNVTGNLNIKAATKTPKTYTVTVEGDGAADVTAADSATYGTDYSFKLTKDAKYTYGVDIKVGENNIQPTVSEDNYTIKGADVTGNIIISVSKELNSGVATEITFTGSGSADVKGGVTQVAENGKDFKFEINEENGYEYTVTLDNETLIADAEGKYTIPGSKINGTAFTVTVEKTEKSKIQVEVSQYIVLNGKTMWLVKASGTVSEGKILAYDSNPMFWSEKYDAYSYLVVSEKTKAEMETEAAGKIAEASATKTDLAYDFDVNRSGQVDINDAQLVYGMYNAKYENFDSVSMRKFLEADVTADGTVTVEDAAAVVNSFIK